MNARRRDLKPYQTKPSEESQRTTCNYPEIESNQDAFNFIERHLITGPIVELGSPRRLVRCD